MSNELSQEEYLELYDLLRESVKRTRERYKSYDYTENAIKAMALLNAHLTLAYRHKKRWRVPRNKVWTILRDARRARGNPALSNLSGVIIVNDIFDMIDNISGTKPADVESSMLELKDTIRNMNTLKEQAKAVTEKCDVISSNLNNIRQYVEGEIEELKINSGCKHTSL